MQDRHWRRRCKDALAILEVAKKCEQPQEVRAARPFVIIVRDDGHCDYIRDAAHGHNVPEADVEACVKPYKKQGRITIVFDLNGAPPRVLPNSEKGGE